MIESNNPLVEPLLARPSGGGLGWYLAVAVVAWIVSALGGLVGLDEAGLYLLAVAGLFELADALRRWRQGVPTRRQLESWASAVNHHVLLRLTKEELRRGDPEWSLDGPWREQRLKSDDRDRRNLLHLMYVIAPPWTRQEGDLKKDQLEESRLQMLHSRLGGDGDPWDANGESNRILDTVRRRSTSGWFVTST